MGGDRAVISAAGLEANVLQEDGKHGEANSTGSEYLSDAHNTWANGRYLPVLPLHKLT